MVSCKISGGSSVEWDEVRFIDGYPGKYVVLARRSGEKWYVAAINADKETLKLNIDLSFLGEKKVKWYGDDKNIQPQLVEKKLKTEKPVALSLAPQGGIVIVAH